MISHDGKYQLIDYTALSCTGENLNEWMLYMEQHLKGLAKKHPHVTISYSRQRIKYFPLFNDMDGEITQFMGSESVILNKDNFKGFDIFTDPFGSKHVILLLEHPNISKLHEEYRKRGATWDFDKYRPHITIESGSNRTLEEVQQWKLPNRLVLNTIKFSRFGERII